MSLRAQHSVAHVRETEANAAAAVFCCPCCCRLLLLQVYSVLLGPVFEPLLQVAYTATTAVQQPQQQQSAGTAATAAATAVATAAQQLLCDVLFEQQHLGGLCEIVAGAANMHLDGLAAAAAAGSAATTAGGDAEHAATAATATPNAAADAPPPAKRRKAQQADKQQQQQQAGVECGLQGQVSVLLDPAVTALLHKNYQGQLLLRLAQLVRSSVGTNRPGNCGASVAAGVAEDALHAASASKKQRKRQQQQQQQAAAVHGQKGAHKDAAAAGAAALHALPQLLQGFVQAVRFYRRTLEEGEARARLYSANELMCCAWCVHT
jgi:hypothetical protein